jgi:hypothetical protein
MGNHLRNLIESYESGQLDVIDGIEHGHDDVVVMDWFRSVCNNAVCFDMGEVEKLAVFSIQPKLFKLPYQICWFECFCDVDPSPGMLAGRHLVGMLAREPNDDGNSVFVLMFSKPPAMKWCLRGIFWAWVEDNKIKTEQLPGYLDDGRTKKHPAAEFVDYYKQPLFSFISALNCCNIERINTPIPEKLQKARSKREKKPLFSTWTLEIDLNHEASGSCRGNGTHASPRVHLRRGHIRHYRGEKWCWVQACVVGNKKNGIVLKDYAVKGY